GGLPSHDPSFVHQEPEGEGGQFRVRVLNSLWPSKTANNEKHASQNAKGYSVVEDGEIEGLVPPALTKEELPSLGKLRRIGTVGGTAESRWRSCRHILPNYCYKQDGSEGLMPHVS